ncbi:hypothetical protein FSP39_004169 [Pinctada imbricata]|uniref:TIR domain-containing protein n=1 Tax=Pinctada imbricata TaxID=66713 RepID=A0AA89C4T9_PINIB|nr:hypothetical protein FSP39_004169 [Pinctada imbricata]
MFGYIHSVLALWIVSQAIDMTHLVVQAQVKDTHDCKTTEYVNCTKLSMNCKCKTDLAVCTDVSYIPQMPDCIKAVIIQKSHIRNLTQKTFQNLQGLNLTYLHLRNNHIVNVSEDSFGKLHHLKSLVFQKEKHFKPNVMRNLLFNVTRNLVSLKIDGFNWTSVWNDFPHDLFAGLRNSSVQNVSLTTCNMSRFNGSWFDNVDTLRSLDLSENFLRNGTARYNGLNTLQSLNLAFNSYKYFPDFCENKLPSLKKLNFASNKITDLYTLHENLKCLDELEELNINGHAIRIIYQNTFSSLRSLKVLRISELSQIRYISGNAFNSSSLQSIFFYDNGFIFSKHSLDTTGTFANIPNLQNLDISRNYLDMKTTDFQHMLQPLTNLTNLTMYDLGLFFLPYNLSGLLPSLISLNVSKNEFSKLDGPRIFGEASTIKRLSLSQNRISIFNQSTLTESLLDNLDFLNLSRNPLSCSCQDIKWLYNWLQRPKNKKRVASLDITKCESPDYLKGKVLISLTLKEICPMSEEVKHLIIGLCVSVFLILLVAGILYSSRWHIRHWLFIVRSSRQPGYSRIPSDDFVYDGFLVYAEDDRRFVHDTILPRIENQEGYKLCVHFRDFDVGKFIADNIVENMNKSRKVIVILSNSFAKSRWCDFELMIAQRRLLSERGDILILILYKDIDFRHMSSSLRMLLTTMTYAKWTNDCAGQAVFWEQILYGLRRTQNQQNRDEYKAYQAVDRM